MNSSSAVASSNFDESVLNGIITLKFLNSTWIQIRDINENIIISQLMESNEEYNYNMKDKYSLTAGNAGNILVLINKEVRGKVGNFGEVVDSIIIDSNFSN